MVTASSCDKVGGPLDAARGRGKFFKRRFRLTRYVHTTKQIWMGLQKRKKPNGSESQERKYAKTGIVAARGAPSNKETG